jgi:hypothetical protein
MNSNYKKSIPERTQIGGIIGRRNNNLTATATLTQTQNNMPTTEPLLKYKVSKPKLKNKIVSTTTLKNKIIDKNPKPYTPEYHYLNYIYTRNSMLRSTVEPCQDTKHIWKQLTSDEYYCFRCGFSKFE